LLAGFLAVSIEVGSPADPSAAVMIFAAMLGVSAMAVQNVLVQISLKEATRPETHPDPGCQRRHP
jgi:hypothetical protein